MDNFCLFAEPKLFLVAKGSFILTGLMPSRNYKYPFFSALSSHTDSLSFSWSVYIAKAILELHNYHSPTNHYGNNMTKRVRWIADANFRVVKSREGTATLNPGLKARSRSRNKLVPQF